LEEAGLPFEDPPQEIFAGAQSRGEIIRLARQRGRQRSAAVQVET